MSSLFVVTLDSKSVVLRVLLLLRGNLQLLVMVHNLWCTSLECHNLAQVILHLRHRIHLGSDAVKHIASFLKLRQVIFDADDLQFFGLTVEDADEASLKKSYCKKALVSHPDKGGSNEAFQQVNFVYEKLRRQFKTLRSVQDVKPDVTVASVTTSAKNNEPYIRVASKTAPAWNVTDILQPVLPFY